MSFVPVRFTTYLTTMNLLDNLKEQSHEAIRTEGIALQSLKDNPLQQIFAWADLQHSVTNIHTENIEDMLHYITWFIVIVMGISGYGLSSALLEYGGEQLVNVLGYFLILIFIPFLFSLYTLLYLLMHRSASTQNTHSILKLLIKFLNTLPFGSKERLQTLLRHQVLLKNMSLSYLQYGSIALSLGALISLTIMITTQDIAFGWSTTLQVTPELLSQITEFIVLPWQTLFPSAVPSPQLIEISHHYRLGNQIDPELIAQAKMLGSWWQFLALSIVVWGLIPRLFLALLAQRNMRLTIEKMILSHPNSALLLKQMNEIYITTRADTAENENNAKTTSHIQLQHNRPITIATLIGWNLGRDQLSVIMEAKQITADHVYNAGGRNTLEDDNDIISEINTPVIILVKAWEPPMRDFLDFVSGLYAHSTEAIAILPIGTAQKQFMAEETDVSIWNVKIASLQEPRIGIHHDSL